LILCIFPWPLRCHLALPDDIAFRVQTGSGTAFVRCRTTNGASILSYEGDTCPWLKPGYDGLKSELILSFQSGVKVPGRYTYLRQHEPWVDGVVYPGKYSQLEIAFEMTGQEVLSDHEQYSQLLNWVEFVAQNFVGMYAGVTQEIDLVQPRLEDLDETRIFIADDYDLTGKLMNANFQNVRMHAPPPRQASLRYHKYQPSDEKLEEFANYLRNGYALSLSQQLMQRAKEQVHIHRNYDLSIIIVAMAFEVAVREMLTSACEAKGINVLARKLGRGKKANIVKSPYKEAIERGDLKSDLLEYVNQVGGNNGRDTREYTAWVNQAYGARHAIVHQGKGEHTDREAEAAFQAAVAYMEFLRASLA